MNIKHELREDPVRGKLLWLSDGKTELACALDYGIRIMHLSCCGMENLLYVQSKDCSDGFTTPGGWRLRGGHRFWAAPESDDSYYPDNDPVAWDMTESGVILTQQPDPMLQMQKTVQLQYCEDGSILVRHTLKNLADTSVQAAAWGVTTLKPGGKATMEYPRTNSGELNPKRTMALWGGTSLSDPRLHFEPDAICAEHAPADAYFKLGIYSSTGRIFLENLHQRLELRVKVLPLETQPDGGSNLELFMHSRFQELETLGKMETLAPQAEASHEERWFLNPINK